MVDWGGRGGGGEAEREEWAPMSTIAAVDVADSCACRARQQKERVARRVHARASTRKHVLARVQCTTRLQCATRTTAACTHITASRQHKLQNNLGSHTKLMPQSYVKLFYGASLRMQTMLQVFEEAHCSLVLSICARQKKQLLQSLCST